jgi:hypothetical protein
MSYDLILKNSTGSVLDASDGKRVEPGESWRSEKQLGNAYFHSDEVGSLSFRDIGDTHISGDSKETWGVLISYQGEEFVGRYEGAGILLVEFNAYGQMFLSDMDLRQVALPAMQVALPARA